MFVIISTRENVHLISRSPLSEGLCSYIVTARLPVHIALSLMSPIRSLTSMDCLSEPLSGHILEESLNPGQATYLKRDYFLISDSNFL